MSRYEDIKAPSEEDLDVNAYSITDLLTILGLTHPPNSKDIQQKTQAFIQVNKGIFGGHRKACLRSERELAKEQVPVYSAPPPRRQQGALYSGSTQQKEVVVYVPPRPKPSAVIAA